MTEQNISLIVKPLLKSYFPSDVPYIEDNFIQDVHSIQFLEKADEINQLQLINSESDTSNIEVLIKTDDPDLQSIGWCCIAGIHTFNGNYTLASAAFSHADIEGISQETLAYMYLEMSNYFRKLEYYSHSITLLKIAESLTTNDKLKWRIRTVRGYIFSHTDVKKAELILLKSFSHYNSTGEKTREVFVLKYLGALKVSLGEYKKAYLYYDAALAIADQLENSEQLDVLNDIGWLNYLEKDYDKARNIFKKILKNDLTHSPYRISLALQNLGCICGDLMDYKGVINFHSQSLIYSEKYKMNDLIFEDYYKIADACEKLGDSGLAAYWNHKGYLKVLSEINNSNFIVGKYQKLILEASYNYLSNNQRLPYLNPTEKAFEFAINISLQEIRRIFETAFFLKHYSRSKSDIELCQKLNISRKSFFNYKKKLNLLRDAEVEKLDNRYLNMYISSLLYLTWSEVKNKYEKDLFTFLLKKFKNNKKALAESLAISYSSLCLKTQIQ